VPSPNGRLIAFTRHWQAPGGQVWVMSSSGRSQRLVGSSPWTEELIGGWAPDSRRLVYSDSHRLVLVNAGGGSRVLARARQHPHQDIGSASFSPDGRRIVYEREDHFKFSDNLWIYDIASGHVSQLTHDGESRTALGAERDRPLASYSTE
jgi:Tol biopolymer transport system component